MTTENPAGGTGIWIPVEDIEVHFTFRDTPDGVEVTGYTVKHRSGESVIPATVSRTIASGLQAVAEAAHGAMVATAGKAPGALVITAFPAYDPMVTFPMGEAVGVDVGHFTPEAIRAAAADAARRRRRRKITPDLLQETADTYRANPDRPTLAVADHFGVSKQQASRYIAAARDAELLAPYGQD